MESPSSTNSQPERKRQKRELPTSPLFRLYRIRHHEQCRRNDLDTDIASWFSGLPEYAFISNFMIDLDWVISAVPNLASIPEVVIIHGEGNDTHLRNSIQRHKLKNFVLHKPPLPIPYGTHHSKACILKYENGIRVVVHTANLLYGDCGNKTQGAWVQDFPLKTTSTDASQFENDLVNYLVKLQLPGRKKTQLIEIIKKHDFSLARAKLIASVPGYHKGAELNKFGHVLLAKHLGKEKFADNFKKAPIVCQFSSLGSLDTKWLFEEFLSSLSKGKCQNGDQLGTPNNKNLQLVWPTVSQVQNSCEGWGAGQSIPGPQKNIEKPFLNPLWHKFDGDHLGREHQMPHIKTYARYQNSEIAWVLLTSHNLSKAAWGTFQKQETQLMIRSYELGVLFTPSLEEKYWSSAQSQFSCTSARAETPQAPLTPTFYPMSDDQLNEPDGIPCPLPFKIPPQQYGSEDKPWIVDKQYKGLDSLEKQWGDAFVFYGLKESG